MDVKMEVKREEDYILFSVTGEIDLYNAKQLKDKVNTTTENAKTQNLILNLLEVDYIDSTGLGILIGIKRRTSENNGKMVLVLVSERISKLFEITGLSNIFVIKSSIQEAVEELQKQG
ncbi:MAG TPA: STAS domain-containing protein [bacterium]|nr:STAS domain-containing protein [bacterium]